MSQHYTSTFINPDPPQEERNHISIEMLSPKHFNINLSYDLVGVVLIGSCFLCVRIMSSL